MNFSKALIIVIALFAILGAFTFANSLNVVSADNSTSNGGTWIAFNSSNVGMNSLTATITATIHNSGSHVEIFKISQVYTANLVDGPITWTVSPDSTNPTAENMIDNTNPGSSPSSSQGDLGWEIQPGETKTVTFTEVATGTHFAANDSTSLGNQAAVPNTYWPLIPDMGLSASSFEPNEIQTLNPNLQLQSWCGTFSFNARNDADYPIAGIIRGPIIPTDSQLTSSDPPATFQDQDIVGDTGVAAWDVHMASGESDLFTYTYKWPKSGSGNEANFGNGSSVFAPGNATNSTPTVPSQNTGVPYGLFILAAGMVAAGVGYAKFLR
jgi:hypothetical protein